MPCLRARDEQLRSTVLAAVARPAGFWCGNPDCKALAEQRGTEGTETRIAAAREQDVSVLKQERHDGGRRHCRIEAAGVCATAEHEREQHERPRAHRCSSSPRERGLESP